MLIDSPQPSLITSGDLDKIVPVGTISVKRILNKRAAAD